MEGGFSAVIGEGSVTVVIQVRKVAVLAEAGGVIIGKATHAKEEGQQKGNYDWFRYHPRFYNTGKAGGCSS